MTYDEKKFLELLLEFKSEDTKKARRNLSAIAFTVISAQIIGIDFKDIRFLSIDISKAQAVPVLVLAISLLLYWALMFFLSNAKDREFQRERDHVLLAEAESFKKRLIEINKRREASEGATISDEHVVKAAVEAYDRQAARTKTVSILGKIIGFLENFTPTSLLLVALYILSQKLYLAL